MSYLGRCERSIERIYLDEKRHSGYRQWNKFYLCAGLEYTHFAYSSSLTYIESGNLQRNSLIFGDFRFRAKSVVLIVLRKFENRVFIGAD